MSNTNVLKSSNNNYLAAITDGELLDKLEHCKHELESRLFDDSHHHPSSDVQIERLKVLIRETIELLEEIGYDCSVSRSFI